MQTYPNLLRLLRLYVSCGLAIIVLALLPSKLLFAASCESVARIVSLEGAIEYKTADTGNWKPASLEQVFCNGDALRSGRDSRVALSMINNTLLRLDHSTAIIFTSVVQKERSLLEQLRGVLHFISRVPRSLEVNTPYLNAAIEGTEFVVNVKQDSTEITVFEGKVVASNEQGSIDLTTNQTGSADSGQAPVKTVVAQPRDAVAWALYYPPLAAHQDRAGELAYKAIDAIVRNDIERATTLAQQAIAENSQSAAAFMAQSYVNQARFDIPAALQHSRKAAELAPQDAIAQARLAEVLLMTGDIESATIAATNAVQLDSSLSNTQTVLGFAYLAQVEVARAIDAFNTAIILDQAAPLPRLGLGLAMIRAGDLAAGRLQIEIAVILDPGNALIRSYMGKTYYEEKRDGLAASQYAMAKELDPLDPTPWFYDAIRKQTENRPIEALADLEASIGRNDNRAVYRSRPNLDRDRAARGTSQAHIYDDLGFQQLGVVEGTKSLSIDPANYSAHRFLSDSYAARPRHEIARASELLQSQLLQPININPVQPQLPEIDLNIVTGAGPAEAAFNEFTPLFEGNGHQLVFSGVAGSNDTWADEVVLSGISDRISYSIGQFHHESDGFRTNNDLEHDIYNLFVQAALNEKTNIQFEFRKRETEQGDLRLNFDPDDFSISERREIEQDVARLGLHFAPSTRSDFMVSLIQTSREEALTQMNPMTPTVDVGIETESDDIQGQYLFRSNRFNVTAGLGTSDIDVEQLQVVDISPTLPGGICPPGPPFFGICAITTPTDPKTEQHNGYVYLNLIAPADLTWTFGVSHDSVEEAPLDVDKSNPKLGLQWDVTDRVRLRAAYLETVKRTLVAEQTLEPTQVAGFAQFFDDLTGTQAERYGVGIDVTLRQPMQHNVQSRAIYAGFEFSKRDLEIPLVEGTTGLITPEDQSEDLNRIYLYWTPNPEWAVRLEIQHERFKRKDTLGLGLPIEVETTSLPFVVRYFQANGIFAQVGTTFVQQDINLAPTSNFDQDSDDFVVVDAAIGYRLPRRRGILSLEVRNLFDEDFLFQDANIQQSEPSNPRFIPELTVMGRVTLSF